MKTKRQAAKPKAITFLITGDIVVDHHLYQGERDWPSTTQKRATIEATQIGGAGLIHRLLQGRPEIWRAQLGLKNDLDLYPHCYAVWKPFPKTREPEETATVWRAMKAFGYSDWPSNGTVPEKELVKPSAPAHAEMLVIDDAGMRFRKEPKLWPEMLSNTKDAPRWLIWKMFGSLLEGPLWDELSSNKVLMERTILVLSGIALRRSDLSIARGPSWERVAMDTVRELMTPSMSAIRKCRHVVISFKEAGAILADFTNTSSPRFSLIYDPQHMEADLDDKDLGRVPGFQSCFTAGIAWEFALKSAGKPSLSDGIRRGLKAMQLLSLEGHGPVGKQVPNGIPFARIRNEALQQPSHTLAEVQIPYLKTHKETERWTILGQVAGVGGRSPAPLYHDATLVALHGISALAGMPSLQIGAFATIDRQEIEPIRVLRLLIERYEETEPQKKPLSIAVFGEPGSGKSFIVEELAYSVLGKNVPFLVFNLSQFSSSAELTGAFHRVRDERLRGRTPVVFWDEFDAQEYRWLQYLLAPMQDGVFQEGQLTHPIGKSIFIFAGGTSKKLSEFGPKESDRSKQWLDFKLKKGPDFVSRLHGHLDLIGLNPGSSSGDICFPVRRALTIRGNLKLGPSDLLAIDRGLLHALLHAKGYAHGARSLDKILGAVRQGGFPLQRASLPPRQILERELDGARSVTRFYELMENYRTDQAEARTSAARASTRIERDLDRFAAHIHNAYRETPEPSADMMKTFAKLDDFSKSSNRAAARRIPGVLAAIGFWIQPGPAQEGEKRAALDLLLRYIELAAKVEHEGWMAFSFENGWKHADIQKKNPKKKIHPALVSYDKLPEVMKEKDRAQVRIYLDIIHKTGFKVVGAL